MKSLPSTRGSWSHVLLAALVAGSAAACSLLNALDEVVPDDAGLGEAGSDAPNDAGAGDVAQEDKNRGVIVVAGTASDDGGLGPVLTALNPENGSELPQARQKLNVASVQYDGLRDLWYVFESGGVGFFPTAKDPVFLHVRQLDTRTGAWQELQSLKIPPIVSFTLVAVLRERIVYVAYRVESDGGTGLDLVTMNVSDPKNVIIADVQPLDSSPIGLIGTRSGSAKGGSINLLRSSQCDGGNCLEFQHVTVPAEDKPAFGFVSTLGNFVGSPAYGSFILGGPQDIVAWSEKVPNGNLTSFSPQNGQVSGVIPFSTNDAFLKPLAFGECLGQALLIGTNQDLAVYSIPLSASNGKTERHATQHSGQGIYFEPFTSTVLAPFSQGDNFELTAFKLEGTKAEPTLTPRNTPDWVPPSDLRPEIIATRTPLPIACP